MAKRVRSPEAMERIRHQRRAARAADPEAARARERAWRQQHPEASRASVKKWYAKNADKERPKARARYIANHEAETARQRRYRENNREQLRDRSAAYEAANREARREKTRQYDATHREKRKAYRAAHPNPEYLAQWERQARPRRRARHLERQATDVLYRIRRSLRSRLSRAIAKGYKNTSAVRDLGCSIEVLKAHLEAQFLPGMTWENYGLWGWHIDHIKELVLFDLTDPEQVKAACHYTNLQPLWRRDNISKGAAVRWKRRENVNGYSRPERAA